MVALRAGACGQQLSLQCAGGHAAAPGVTVTARFHSQGARAWAAPERQHFTNLATLTSPMSADAVVFATNGSGGGDAKAAAGTAMRDARMSSSHVEDTTRCCCRRGQRGRRCCCLYLLMRPRQAQNFCCGPGCKGKFALSCFEQ